jgi:glycosyltransferase involved in cell wall biosynthesis
MCPALPSQIHLIQPLGAIGWGSARQTSLLYFQRWETSIEKGLSLIGGVPTEIHEYQTICDRHNLSDRVHFTGFQADIRPYLWASDLFALPSNYETFSLVSFQAAVAGLPILATQLYGVEEFLEDRVNGWLVERQVSSIANVLAAAVRDRAKMPEMGKLAHEAVSDYDQAIFVERWREVLQKQLQPIATSVTTTPAASTAVLTGL